MTNWTTAVKSKTSLVLLMAIGYVHGVFVYLGFSAEENESLLETLRFSVTHGIRDSFLPEKEKYGALLPISLPFWRMSWYLSDFSNLCVESVCHQLPTYFHRWILISFVRLGSRPDNQKFKDWLVLISHGISLLNMRGNNFIFFFGYKTISFFGKCGS